ncbi:DUF547 domain-containing protein [Planctomycetota bacterium]
MKNLRSHQAKKMTNDFTFFAVILSVLLLIAGCPETREVVNTLPVKPVPEETELPKELQEIVEPVEITTEKIIPQIVEPAKRLEEEPNETKPYESEPNVPDPNVLESNEPKPYESEPNVHEPNESEPNKPRPTKTTHQTTKTQPAVDFHNNCAQILNYYVDEEGMVNYGELRRKRYELRNLLEKFEELDQDEYESWPKEDKIAFWINAYNLEMLNIMVQHYPIKAAKIWLLLWPPDSIRHIGFDTIRRKSKFMIMNEEFTISEVENRFFRKEFEDPRILFALCHACLSSPSLRNEPYTGQKLNEQLDEQVKKYLSGPYGFHIDRNKNTVYISDLLKSNRFGNEFIGKYGTDKKFKDQQPYVRAVLNFITKYIPKEDTDYLQTGNYEVEFMDYNWRLNEQ